MTIGMPHILLADDDLDDRDFFRAGMERVYPEISVLSFDDGDKLLEWLENNRWTGAGCILLDYKMPRLNAPQVLSATGAGTRFGQIPKIVWSTSQRKKDMDECLSLGAVHFAVKPITDRQLDDFIKVLGLWIAKSS